jgi:uncharacterized glyoxalase superfamily protein PhnB
MFKTGSGRRGEDQGMTTRTDHNIWTGLTYDDPIAARAWLAALGFEEGILVRDEQAGAVHHSEMLWPEGGRVMVSSRGKGDDTFSVPRGAGSVYVVVDDADAVYQRAKQLGAPMLREMENTDYGSRGFSIADAEGNRWSFGTYAGE